MIFFRDTVMYYCNECLDGATSSCSSITVSRTNNRQSDREGLYEIQSSENSSRCSDRPVWKSQLIDSWIYYSDDDAAWYIADVSCSNTALRNGIDFLAFVVLILFFCRCVYYYFPTEHYLFLYRSK